MQPIFHKKLIDELKATLISKRKAFEKREMDSLKSNDEIESYKACENILSDGMALKKSGLLEHNEPSTSSELQAIKGHCYPMDKGMALEAIDKLKLWNKHNPEVCFGDEFDSEDDDSY